MISIVKNWNVKCGRWLKKGTRLAGFFPCLDTIETTGQAKNSNFVDGYRFF